MKLTLFFAFVLSVFCNPAMAIPYVYVDLRVSSVTGGEVVNQKYARVNSIDSIVEMDFYVLIRGDNASHQDELFRSGIFGFKSNSCRDSKGNIVGLRGHLGPATIPLDFQGSGWSSGYYTDVDGDGDYDRGNVGLNTPLYTWCYPISTARSLTPSDVIESHNIAGVDYDFAVYKIATVDFWINCEKEEWLVGFSTPIIPILRKDGLLWVYEVDGVPFLKSGGAASTWLGVGLDDGYGTFPTIEGVLIPEPISLVMLFVGGLLLLRRKRILMDPFYLRVFLLTFGFIVVM